MDGITWLHLSDWHQAGQDFDREIVRDKLLEDIRGRSEISPALERIDFIIFSGDLAYNGKAEEYEAAAKYLLDPICQHTGVKRDRVIFVPGNHDMDRSLLEFVPCSIANPFTDRAEVNKWLQDGRHRSRLLEPFEAFTDFVSRYGSRQRAADAHVVGFEAAGKKVAILALNSALMCGRFKGPNGEVNDKEQLTVGEPQAQFALKGANGADW